MRVLFAILLAGALAECCAGLADPLYELAGQVRPEAEASLTLFGAVTPFHAFTLSDDSGRFTFKKLEASAYTLGSIYVPGRGEARKTVEIGPGHRRLARPGRGALRN